ncbi:helix-turn-helix transcriptional regulator [Kitasatospora sp. NPDC057940]|uniref:helix-turn-helix transcriptional regulator n=1 Tax=Kitasatospora sp. NPDC057940 TaxID=3346285 RepID=UPI0036DF297F
MDTMHDNTLAVLGVSASEEAVYRATLRSPGLGIAEIAIGCGIDPKEAEALLARLRDLGLVNSADQRTFSGADPVSVVERLSRMRIKGLQGEIRQIASSHHLTESLLHDQLNRQSEPVTRLQYLTGLAQVVACVDELSFFAREERLTTYPGPILAAALDDVRRRDLTYARRLRMRTIVHTSALGTPEVGRFAAELSERGAQVRGTTEPLDRMVIFDRRTALVAMDPADITRGALLVRAPGLVSNLVTLFECRWSRSHWLEDDLPSATERRVLDAMARVDKDATGARELGMSLRTYRRHVAALMHRLEAPNRFRAALAARERQWF